MTLVFIGVFGFQLERFSGSVVSVELSRGKVKSLIRSCLYHRERESSTILVVAVKNINMYKNNTKK